MSHHHHHDENTDMVNTPNGENTISRRHSHTHLHLKPTTVFDHLKTKVKRKRASHHNITEIPAFATDNHFNGNHIPKRTSQEHNELDLEKAFTVVRSRPDNLLHRTSSISSENKKIELKNSAIEKVEQPAIISNHIDEDAGLSESVHLRSNPIESVHLRSNPIESVQLRSNPIESDIETNTKHSKSKSKLNKVAKSPLETSTKKRRQSTRRTEFQIRDEEFNNIFNDLPADEQLIVAYPCAWRKDVFMHGRMFLSVNYLCFYTCFFKWEESVCIAYKDIVSVKREKSAKLIPNAIHIRTKNRDQYLFASYTPRERIFIAIFRLWQNALLEKPLDYQQLKTIVYADQMNLDETTGDSEESINDEHFPNLSQSSPAIVSNRSREPTKISDEGSMSSSPGDPAIYVSSCPCETHLARTYAERVFSYHVHQLFELIFGNNSFTRAFHDSQKLIDYTIGEWRRNNETGKRERQVTYKTVTQSILGTNTITCTEKQIVESEKSNSMYVVNTEVYNEGMKYTDAFFVATRFCMFQRDAKHSSLRVSAEVRYVKNVNAIAKSFIEKNCNSNIEDGVNNQIRRLENHQTTVNNHKSNEDQTSISKQRVRKRKGDVTNSDDRIITKDIPSENLGKTITGKGLFVDIGLFIGILILLLHFYLCYKLNAVDQMLHTSDSTCLNQCKADCVSNKPHR